VRAGDNLFRIALKFGSSVQAIRAANGISGNWIYPSQQLIIP
jgi:LysM repeat protein